MRVVLLGASNLVRQPWIVLETARLALGASEIEALGAFGHGRSYGQRSRFLGRSLPGILDCGLWRALAERPSASTYALVTDIGNDIPYGAHAATIAEWVEESVRRLLQHGASVVMTGLPTVSLERFADWQIRLARQLFFPFSTLTAADIRSEVAELDARLREIPARCGVTWVEHEVDWYGVDPIHFRRSKAPEAFARMLCGWTGSMPETPARSALGRKLLLRSLLPESWRLLGLELGGRQGTLTLPGPVRVSLY